MGQYKTWTLDWTMDWTLDSIMDPRFGLGFRLPGVEGHVHVNQHQAFKYSHLLVVE